MIISLTTGRKMKMKHLFIQLLKTKNICIRHLAYATGKIEFLKSRFIIGVLEIVILRTLLYSNYNFDPPLVLSKRDRNKLQW